MAHEKTVLSSKFGGGPHGVGDPADLTLRKVEIEVLIPKKMREITRTEKCVPQVEAFNVCCKQSGLGMAWTCQKQNQDMKDCMLRWYQDEAFKERCKNEYLAERSEFRRTGVTKKKIEFMRGLKHEIAAEKLQQNASL